MKKYYLRIYQVSVAILAIAIIIFSSLFIANSDEIITENITLEYFEKSLNNYDERKLKDFVANSENDILYNNLIDVYSRYRGEGSSNYKYTIDKKEVFGEGKYQCYFNLKGVPTCDLHHEGRYMNYLIESTTSYINEIGIKQVIREKGIVVFIKDGSNGNFFEWKLVRYNTYQIN